MADLTSIASFWSEQGENWAGGSPINTAIQACLAMHPVAKEAETAIATINSSGYESIGSACLSVQESEIKKANEALPKFQTFCQAIHLEISILVDAPFGTAMGSLTESLFGIRPEEFTVNRGGILGAFGATFNIYDLVKKVIKDDALKLDFEGRMEDLQEPASDEFFRSMLTALSLDLEGITDINILSETEVDRFCMYYLHVFREGPSNLYEGNIAKNALIDAINQLNKNIGHGIYINGQSTNPYKDYTFGSAGNFADNGCLIIAMYNALISLGDFWSPAELELFVDSNLGTILGGIMGGRPSMIPAFFTNAGYSVTYHGFLPDTNEIEKIMKTTNGPTIILYFYVRKEGIGGHYIMMEYDQQSNDYLMYNRYSDVSECIRVKNLDSLRTHGRFVYTGYTIEEKK